MSVDNLGLHRTVMFAGGSTVLQLEFAAIDALVRGGACSEAHADQLRLLVTYGDGMPHALTEALTADGTRTVADLGPVLQEAERRGLIRRDGPDRRQLADATAMATAWADALEDLPQTVVIKFQRPVLQLLNEIRDDAERETHAHDLRERCFKWVSVPTWKKALAREAWAPRLMALQDAVAASSDVAADLNVKEALYALLEAIRSADASVKPMARKAAEQALAKKMRAADARAMLDAVWREAETAAKGDTSVAPGEAVTFIEPPDHADAVNGIALLNQLAATFVRYVVLPSGAAYAAALWVLHTYAMDASDVSSFLAVLSPTWRCGKSTTLKILARLVARPLESSNITPAAVYRVIAAHRPTLILDEADTFLDNEASDLRGVLNSGHERELAFVLRADRDNGEVRRFSTYCAKAYAMIGVPPPTIRDRSIGIRLQRKKKTDVVQRLPRRDQLDLEPLRAQCAKWVRDHLDVLKAADPPIPEDLDDRQRDNWRPLLGIADAAGGPWPKWARSAARLLSGVAADEPSVGADGVELLAAIRTVFDKTRREQLVTDAMLGELGVLPESRWKEYGRSGKPITDRALAGLLRDFNIRPTTLWPENHRGYRKVDFVDAWSRYLDAEPPADTAPGSPARGPSSAETTFHPHVPQGGNENLNLDSVFDPHRAGHYPDPKTNVSSEYLRQHAVYADQNAENSASTTNTPSAAPLNGPNGVSPRTPYRKISEMRRSPA